MMHPSVPLLAAASLLASWPAAAADAPSSVTACAERVADYQLAHPGVSGRSSERLRRGSTGWIEAAFDAGLCALDRASGLPRFRDALLEVGRRNAWRLGPRAYHADDLCVGQTYLYLYGLTHDPRMIAAVRARCDWILAHPPGPDLAFAGRRRTDNWTWCDSLFMAPPVWAELAEATGNPAYRQYMERQWWRTSDYLYDRQERLFYRDSTYFDQREPNGRKVFWSRGNGWVLAGLAQVIDHLPADDPERPRFVAQFRALAERVRQLQGADGMWSASLLDPGVCRPHREVSGTAFFCYGFAWGVNRGILDRSTFVPAAWAAWNGLLGCVEPDGRLTHVQPMGAAPANFPADATEPYGVGGFLFAATEIARLARQPR